MIAVMPNLADIVGKLASDLGSPRVVDDIDRVLVHLLSLRNMAADLHGVNVAAPVMLVTPVSDAAPSFSVANDSKPQGEARNISTFVHLYRTDLRSPFLQIRHKTRENYTSLIKRIVRDFGDAKPRDLVAEDFERLYARWRENGHIAMAHSLVTMLRQIIHFGATVIEDPDCLRVSVILHRMKFETTPPRAAAERITVEHVLAIRAQAHKDGAHMLAFAQSLQWDGKLAQKDVLGEWVPHNESTPVTSVLDGDLKWVRGITWNQVDDNMVLQHVTSARAEKISVDLKRCPMVMDELRHRLGLQPHQPVTRDMLPSAGPMVINEETGLPYLGHKFRRAWRKIATAAGVPLSVENRDSRLAKGKRSGWQKLVEKSSAQ
jgi:hypothetical protein